MILEFTTDSPEALEAASREGATVWIHGSITYVTIPDEVPVEAPQIKPTKKSKTVHKD